MIQTNLDSTCARTYILHMVFVNGRLENVFATRDFLNHLAVCVCWQVLQVKVNDLGLAHLRAGVVFKRGLTRFKVVRR